MIQNKLIIKRLKVLKSDIDDINQIYKDTLKDPYNEAGIEYGKWYPYDEALKIEKEKVSEQKRLIQLQVDRLYGRIFNFTQTYYAVKESLIKTHPKKEDPKLHKIIDDYFCNDKIDGISRIDICNKLKHDPQKDLLYKGHIRKEKIRTDKGMTYIYTKAGQPDHIPPE